MPCPRSSCPTVAMTAPTSPGGSTTGWRAHFGQGAVFIDIDAIPLGLDFRKHLGDAVNQCDILLAVIGDHWLDARYENGPSKGQRRLDDPHDFVRIEIESALARGIPVVPLLVGRNAMPAEADLPDGLKELAYRNAAEVRSGPDFHGQVDRLDPRFGTARCQKAGAAARAFKRRVHIANEDPQDGPRPRPYGAGADGARRLRTAVPTSRQVTRSLENLIERLDQKGFLPGKLDVDQAAAEASSAAGTSRWGETVTEGDVHQALAQLTDILKWYIEVEQAGCVRPATRADRNNPRPDRVEIYRSHASRLPSFLRVCGHSTPTTAISSCSFFPVLATRTACPRASASGNTASRRATRSLSPWA